MDASETLFPEAGLHTHTHARRKTVQLSDRLTGAAGGKTQQEELIGRLG